MSWGCSAAWAVGCVAAWAANCGVGAGAGVASSLHPWGAAFMAVIVFIAFKGATFIDFICFIAFIGGNLLFM